jgi:hypothetical protein
MTRATLRVSFALFAATALVSLAGCNDDGTGTSVQAVRGLHGAGADTSSDGRIAARALINRDGTTDFEATTGTLDSTTPPPGRLDRVDLNVFDTTGSLLASQTLSSASGYLGSHILNVRRGDPFHVDALVTTGTGAPTDAVVTGTARLRPDLAFQVIGDIIGPEHGRHIGQIIGPEHFFFGIIGPEYGSIIGPERPRADTVVHFETRPVELNNDVGAVADCVFAVDGVVVSTQTELAVAAGGQATCAVDYTFTHPGMHVVTFTLSNVKPGDYNNANNLVGGFIQIIGPEHTH